MPNHYLDIDAGKPIRYWPNKNIEYKPVSEIAIICAKIIKGYMRSIYNRYPIMVPVTAGKDSRLLLAASKDFADKVYYYINKEKYLDVNSVDIRIPRKLLSKLKLDFHIIEIPQTVDDNFIKVFFENNIITSTRYLNIIYNYFLNYPEKINLPGNMAASGFGVFSQPLIDNTGESFSKLYKLNQYEFANNYFSSWLRGCFDLCIKYNVNMTNIFYWEERMANWGAQTQLEKDIAQEEINPFNSRLLINNFLSVKPKYIKPPIFVLHKEIMKILWPEVLSIPINPSFINKIKSFLFIIGLLSKYHEIKRNIKLLIK